MWWFDVYQPLDGSPAAALAERFAGYGPLVERLLETVRDADLESFRHVTTLRGAAYSPSTQGLATCGERTDQ